MKIDLTKSPDDNVQLAVLTASHTEDTNMEEEAQKPEQRATSPDIVFFWPTTTTASISTATSASATAIAPMQAVPSTSSTPATRVTLPQMRYVGDIEREMQASYAIGNQQRMIVELQQKYAVLYQQWLNDQSAMARMVSTAPPVAQPSQPETSTNKDASEFIRKRLEEVFGEASPAPAAILSQRGRRFRRAFQYHSQQVQASQSWPQGR
ncbi:hypothetical protein U1Q18_050574 [Sarracenia purpurea var. burkii]